MYIYADSNIWKDPLLEKKKNILFPIKIWCSDAIVCKAGGIINDSIMVQ